MILSVAMWAVFSFIILMIASLIAMTITAGGGAYEPDDYMRGYTAIYETIWSLSPNYHFNKIGEHLVGTYATWRNGVEGTPITSSLINAGPNILVLAIVTTLFFIASYIAFIRQEIR